MAKKRGKLKSTRSTAINKQPAMEAANGQSSPISVAASPITVLMKVCRLCETKEGPFLNIFGGEKNTAKKIEELMPFGVAENDELPHKICFRCSAKVEELHEFVQKCIKTQENLYNYLGKKCPTTKVKTHRSLWEEKLNRSNITNDDICDAVIKKAMEGIKDIPLKLLPSDTKVSESKISSEKSIVKSKVSISDTLTNKLGEDVKKIEVECKKKISNNSEKINNKNEDLCSTEEKLSVDRCEDKVPNKTRSSRSKNEAPLLEGIPLTTKKIKPSRPRKTSSDASPSKTVDNVIEAEKRIQPKNTVNSAPVAQQNPTIKKNIEPYKPFDIMEHVSMIKVNGVGVLFQCKLCNRNFLKKEVVLSHWCAKNGAAKEDFIKRAAPPEPPRVPTVKYINTKTDDTKKHQVPDNIVAPIKTNHNNKETTETEIKNNIPGHKKKPKIGPACKVKRTSDDTVPLPAAPEAAPESATESTPLAKSGSVVEMPAVPSLNCRYKLVPGPNNTFTLVEAHPTNQKDEKQGTNTYGSKKRKLPAENEESGVKQRKVLRSENSDLHKTDSASKSSPEIIDLEDQDAEDEKNKNSKNKRKILRSENASLGKADASSPGIIDLQEQDKKLVSQPYPVGLFQTVGRHSKTEKPPVPAVVPFATTAQKKQSYTIVQTGNPSKLLISAKPQPPTEEIPKKKQKKLKPAVQEVAPLQKQPFSVTLEDASHPKDSGFFTFINVDPLLQPSYVLPTDSNTVQESHITTSQATQNPSKSAQYTCNMCDETFNREQKLLVHINCHYSKMDEEDQMRTDKPSRKRGKKS